MPDDRRGRAGPVSHDLAKAGGCRSSVFPMDHGEFSRTRVIGDPMTATAEKGEEALERFAEHLVKAIDAFRPLEVSVTRRALEDRV